MRSLIITLFIVTSANACTRMMHQTNRVTDAIHIPLDATGIESDLHLTTDGILIAYNGLWHRTTFASCRLPDGLPCQRFINVVRNLPPRIKTINADLTKCDDPQVVARALLRLTAYFQDIFARVSGLHETPVWLKTIPMHDEKTATPLQTLTPKLYVDYAIKYGYDAIQMHSTDVAAMAPEMLRAQRAGIHTFACCFPADKTSSCKALANVTVLLDPTK